MEKGLISGTIIYIIGTFISKLMQILILPIITIFFTTGEYGYYDFLVTISGVVIPLISLQTIDGVFRFLFDVEYDEKISVVTSTVFIVIVGFFLLGILMFFYGSYVLNQKYIPLLFIYIVTNMIYILFQKIARGFKHNKVYATSGILFTLILLIFQYFFIVVFDFRIDGLLISGSIAAIVSACYIDSRSGIHNFIKFKAISYAWIIKLIKFSAPLIPNTLCIWFISSMNSIVIVTFLGASYNGIYAIAYKFPGLVMMATSAFQMAWQESSIQAHGNKDENEFNSKIFNKYVKFILETSTLLMLVVGIAFDWIIGSSFAESKVYIPILIASSAIYSFAVFFGAGYLSSGKTSGAVITTLFGSVICALVSITFINYIGLFAPALGTLFGYLTMLVARKIQMNSFFKITIDIAQILPAIFMYVLGTFVYYFNNIYITIITIIIAIIYSCQTNKELVNKLIKIWEKR